MKKVKFQELILWSDVEKKAKKITFNDNITIISGKENTTGKSTILKSIYYTLGADVTFEDEWIPLKAKSILKFQINEINYLAFRCEKLIAFFDSDENVIVSTRLITKKLSPFIANLFDFQLPLIKSGDSNDSVQATPAFLYLPFYLDQDSSWQNFFSSFNSLSQFKRWQGSFKEYHTAIKSKEYYIAGNCKLREESILNELEREVKILKISKQKLENLIGTSDFDIDYKKYEKKLSTLLGEFNELNNIEEDYKKTLFQLNERKLECEYQNHQFQNLINEIDNSLIEHNNKKFKCSKCGEEHTTSLYEEYSKIKDKQELIAAFEQNGKELQLVKAEIDDISQKYNEAKAISDKIQNKLLNVEGQLSLMQVMNAHAKNKAQETIDLQIKENFEKQQNSRNIIQEQIKIQKTSVNKQRTKEIKNFYIDLLSEYFCALSVDAADIASYKKGFTPSQSQQKTGSRAPRQMLGVYFAFINTIFNYTTTAFFPIVIDSPKQQEQDGQNSEAIVKFCIEKKPNEAQLIMATLNFPDDMTNSNNISVYNFNEKKALLTTDDYEEQSDFFKRIFSKTLIGQLADG